MRVGAAAGFALALLSACSVYDSSLLEGAGAHHSSRSSASSLQGGGGAAAAGGGVLAAGGATSANPTAGGFGGATIASTSTTSESPMSTATPASSGTGGECTVPGDCAGQDDSCAHRTCNGGTCGISTAPARTGCTENGGSLCDGGGHCVECLDGGDCPSSGVCGGDDSCKAPSCTDGVQNGNETDIDCGGGAPCSPCGLGQHCAQASDCANGFCTSGGVCGCTGDHVLISEVRSRGPDGSSGSGSSNEFVELYNPTLSDVTLGSAWQLVARSDGGSSYTPRWTGSGKSIPSHGHFLIGGSSYSGPPADGALNPSITDVTSLMLTNAGTLVDGICYANSPTTAGHLMAAGYTCLGAVAADNPHDNSTSTDDDASLERKPGGQAGNCVDTQDNASDFQVAMPSTPQNTSSPLTPP